MNQLLQIAKGIDYLHSEECEIANNTQISQEILEVEMKILE
jgi:hypothetical protein